jgi:ERCC4-type nuclease
MLIKIDYRESKLIPLCEALNADTSTDKPLIKIVSENLPLGDIILCNDDGEEKIIIERKSLADLAASIRDGRYKEQSFRLNQCEVHNHHIYYLIEGDLRYYRPFKGLPDKKALLSAMVSMSYFKGFSLYRTNTLEETAEWVIHLATKIMKEGPAAVPYYTGGSTPANYAEVVGKRIKKDNITPANIGEIMLAQIPSVSSASAAAIMATFGTFANLMAALQTNQTSLNAITLANKNGQSKKLSKPCINNIYEFLVKPATITIDTLI